MRISYAITVCNEGKELMRLLSLLVSKVRDEDEIVVQCDTSNTTVVVREVIESYLRRIKLVEFSLNGNFAAYKNNLKKHCTGDWIFQIDADEYMSEEFIRNLHEVLIANPTIELFLVPRINTVEGITENHIRSWRWTVNEKGWINFPDYQTRILQNSPRISWVGKVHEVLTGHTSYAFLPPDEEYCLIHPKTIARQEEQNHYYSIL